MITFDSGGSREPVKLAPLDIDRYKRLRLDYLVQPIQGITLAGKRRYGVVFALSFES